MASDWGIGHLAGVITDFPSLTVQPLAAYPRVVSRSRGGSGAFDNFRKIGDVAFAAV
jgi:hypothetical protein